MTKQIKTYEDWGKARKPIDEFLQVGDAVDREIYNHFLNVLPPATHRSHLLQIGEPYSHVDGKATYFTLAKIDGQWTYVGNCFRGEKVAQ